MEESMKKRFRGAEQALERLHEGTVNESLTEMERDGLIQRFEKGARHSAMRLRLFQASPFSIAMHLVCLWLKHAPTIPA